MEQTMISTLNRHGDKHADIVSQGFSGGLWPNWKTEEKPACRGGYICMLIIYLIIWYIF